MLLSTPKCNIAAIDTLNAHMNAENGVETPFVFEDEGVEYALNLQAFYNLETSIDRTDFILAENVIECNDGTTFYPEGSKFMDTPVCQFGESSFDPYGYVALKG